MSAPVLQVEGVTKRFGGLVALDEVSLEVEGGGAVLGLIGPNGAGKTTLFNCVTGFLRPEAGRITVDGQDVVGLKPFQLAQRGLGRTFQRLEVFDTMTVEHNIQVAVEATEAGIGKVFRGLFRLRHPTDSDVQWRVDEILDMVRLTQSRDQLVGELPTGVGRLVELGRALALRPKLVLLDEPASGLDEDETAYVQRVLSDVAAAEGVSMLLVEHDVELVLSLCSWIWVLDFGRVLAAGTPEQIVSDARVQQAYLGDVVSR